MPSIHTVFWDSDNTLVETAQHHWRKHVEVLKTLDITLDEKYRKKIYENNGFQNHQWIVEELNLKLSQEDYLSKIDAWYFEHINEIKIREGVIEALEYFKNNDVDQAVVSNGRRRSVMAALDAKELTPYFKFTLCKEDYEGRKPSPAPYLTAFDKIQTLRGEKLSPQHCLVVEDDPLGVQAGEAAGMTVLYRPIGDTSSIKTMLLQPI